MIKLHLLAFMSIIVLTAQTALAQTIKNNPPALEEKNSMPNAAYTNKYIGPQIEVTRGEVSLTQGYDKKIKDNPKNTPKAILKNDKVRIEPIENND